jgi:hypothetical protein
MKSADRIKEIKRILSSFVPAEHGRELRIELHEIYKKEYTPKLSDAEYLDFIKDSYVSFNMGECGDQSENSTFYLGIFNIKYQHFNGNTLEHAIDNALGLNRYYRQYGYEEIPDEKN